MADELPGVIIIHNVQTQCIEFLSKRGLEHINVSLEEVKSLSSEGYHSRYFNAEDARDYVPKVYDLINDNDDQRIISFFQQVRPSENEDFQWNFSTTKILMQDDEAPPSLS